MCMSEWGRGPSIDGGNRSDLGGGVYVDQAVGKDAWRLQSRRHVHVMHLYQREGLVMSLPAEGQLTAAAGTIQRGVITALGGCRGGG